MRILKRRLFWGVLALLTTIFAGVIYISVQQALRLGADEPQRSTAQEVARDLENNKNPQELVQGYIDMGQSMAPFIIIYDQYGKVVAGNGYLDSKVPQVPIGVLAASKDHKINAVTWQPADKVRIASVSVQGGNYYVLGGRSLFVVEQQINSFTGWLFAGWAIVLAVLLAVYTAINRRSKKAVASS